MAKRSPSKQPAGPSIGAPPPREPRLLRATSEHYLDAELYDHEYRRRRADLNYYRALAAGRLQPLPPTWKIAPRDVLELGCGSGRLLAPLARDGHRVVGLDLSQPMLRRCAERIAALPPAARARATIVRGDFRAFALGRRFPLIVSAFNAMMHLYTRDDVERFLGCVREHLAPRGVFAFDVMNPDLDWLVRDPTRRWARTRFTDPRDGRVWYYSTNHFYESATQINWVRLYYDEAPPPRARPGATPQTRPETVKSRVVSLAQRQFFPKELADLLHYNGLSVDARDGGFVGERFESDSPSQVCRCSIRGAARR